MFRKLCQTLHEIDDGVNPLVVLEFRRLRRSGVLAVVGGVYFLYLCCLAYYLFREWNIGPDRLIVVLSSLPIPLTVFVAGFYEGRVASEQWGCKDEILELNGLSRYEKYRGHLLIGFFSALFFGMLTVPPTIMLIFVDDRFAWILPVVVFIVAVSQAFRVAYVFNSSYALQNRIQDDFRGEDIHAGVGVFLVIVAAGMLYFAVKLNNKLSISHGLFAWNDWFWFLFLGWCFVVFFTYAVITFALTRYYLRRIGLSCSRIALVNIIVNVSAMVLLLCGWFVLRLLF